MFAYVLILSEITHQKPLFATFVTQTDMCSGDWFSITNQKHLFALQLYLLLYICWTYTEIQEYTIQSKRVKVHRQTNNNTIHNVLKVSKSVLSGVSQQGTWPLLMSPQTEQNRNCSCGGRS